MRIIIILIIVISTIISVGANAQGIQFRNELTWKQVLEKARAEHKYIFVDCFATWCGPCKVMDREVYTLQNVGEYYNQNYIAIKLQFDKTEKDDSLTKKWYSIANNFQSVYSVNAFPTFLFFDSDGNPLHKVIGGLTPNNFIQIAKDAQIQEKQYYTIVKNYIPGKLDTAEIKGLAGLFREENKELAGRMVKDYFDRIATKEWRREDNLRFLIQLNTTKEAGKITAMILAKRKSQLSLENSLSLFNAFKTDSVIQNIAFDQLKNLSKKKLGQSENLELLTIFKTEKRFKNIATNYIGCLSFKKEMTKKDIDLMRNFLSNSNDNAFSILLNYSHEIDSVVQKPRYTEIVLGKVITKEEIEPQIKIAKTGNKEPDWSSIYATIEKKYGKQHAQRNIINAKTEYFRDAKRWNEYAKSLVRYVDAYAPIEPSSSFYLNNMAYEVYENTSDVNDLLRANYWADVAIKDTAAGFYGGYVATKAEIMYKLGFKKESIELMEKAIVLYKKTNPDNAEWFNELDMMKRGERIWPEKVDGK